MAKKKEEYKFWDPKEKQRKAGGKKKGEERKEKREARGEKRDKRKPETRNPKSETQHPKPDAVRLNRFIAQAGICSRREADELIKTGKIKLNGKVVTALGTKVTRKDEISYQGKRLRSQQFVYILLNKPKNTLSTTDDPAGRKTVMDIVANAADERIYPVGTLDRNTTGLLLLTNDGELAKKLTNPSNKVRKLYHVRLDKPIEEDELKKLTKGIELEDGIAKADKIDYVTGKGPNEVGIQIHSGKNRIVRRMFEALGYKVLSLDRVMIAHLNKKNLPRGKWRALSDKEVHFLKMI